MNTQVFGPFKYSAKEWFGSEGMTTGQSYNLQIQFDRYNLIAGAAVAVTANSMATGGLVVPTAVMARDVYVETDRSHDGQIINENYLLWMTLVNTGVNPVDEIFLYAAVMQP